MIILFSILRFSLKNLKRTIHQIKALSCGIVSVILWQILWLNIFKSIFYYSKPRYYVNRPTIPSEKLFVSSLPPEITNDQYFITLTINTTFGSFLDPFTVNQCNLIIISLSDTTDSPTFQRRETLNCVLWIPLQGYGINEKVAIFSLNFGLCSKILNATILSKMLY